MRYTIGDIIFVTYFDTTNPDISKQKTYKKFRQVIIKQSKAYNFEVIVCKINMLDNIKTNNYVQFDKSDLYIDPKRPLISPKNDFDPNKTYQVNLDYIVTVNVNRGIDMKINSLGVLSPQKLNEINKGVFNLIKL